MSKEILLVLQTVFLEVSGDQGGGEEGMQSWVWVAGGGEGT